MARLDVRTKRVFAPPRAEDGYRVLVDGLWPRGLTKDDAALDEWARTIARARTCAAGSPTTPNAGMAFAIGIGESWRTLAGPSPIFGPALAMAR